MANAPQTTVVRFGVYELDLAARQLRKNGVRIKLQDQPFRVLQMLVERPGEVVTRDELREKLWPADTFVEFDHSLNTATQKIRQALGDSASTPRFLETIPRVGYRFVGGVATNDAQVQALPASPTQLRAHSLRLKLLVALSLVGLIALTVVVVARRDAAPSVSGTPRRFVIPTEGDANTAFISPDSSWVAYSTGGSEFTPSITLWIQDLHRDEPQRIAGPGRLGWIGWSPDSSQVAYVDNSTLFRISVGDWQPVPVAKLDFAHIHRLSGTWSPDGAAIVLAAPPGHAKLIEVQVRTGSSRTLLAPDDADFQGSYWYPQYLPGANSKKILYVETRDARDQIVAADIESGKRQWIAEGTQPFYSPSGHVLYQLRGALNVMPFSAETLSGTGPAIEFRRDGELPTIAANGTLIYLSQGGGRQQMVWKDRRGLEVGAVGQPQETMALPELSPGGDRIAAIGYEGGTSSVWVHEVARPAKTRVTFGSIADRAAWHSGGKWIAYTGPGPGSYDIFLISADGSGKPTLLVSTPYPEFPYCWSSDGRRLLFNRNQALGDLWYIEVDENGNPMAEKPILATEFDEYSPMLSPDDRFLAYASDKSGRHEVYVRTFPDGDRDWVISTEGGQQARWRGDGREIYYVDATGSLFVVPITLTPEFSPGRPERLFNHAETLQARGHRYDVTPDGQRFLVVKVLERSKSVIRVVDNWFTELRQLEGGPP